MSKTKTADREDSAVLLRASIISAIILGLGLNAVIFLAEKFAASTPDFKEKLIIGLSLFLTWVVLTSTLRSIDKMREGTDAWKFLLAGMIVVIGGVLLRFLFANLIALFVENWPKSLDLSELGFYAVLGFIISLVSMINLKVKNQFLGNVLEFLVIALVIFLFFTFMK